MSETTDAAAPVKPDEPLVRAPGLDEDLVISFDPITAPGGEQITSITIREPDAGQIALWDNLTGTPAQIKAISVCASVPEAVVRKMKARAFTQAIRRVEAFLA